MNQPIKFSEHAVTVTFSKQEALLLWKLVFAWVAQGDTPQQNQQIIKLCDKIALAIRGATK